MTFKNKYIKYILLTIIVLIIGLIYIGIDYNKRLDSLADEVVKEDLVNNNNTFAIYLQDANDTSAYNFVQNGTIFGLTGTIFNETRSYCEDYNGKVIPNMLTFDNSTHSVTVTSSKIIYCTIYLDRIAAPSTPTLTVTDGVASGSPHYNTSVTFTASGSTLPSGSPGSVVYFYGTTPSTINTRINNGQFTISNATNGTNYYVKACNSLDTSVCSNPTSAYNLIITNDTPSPAPTITATDGIASGETHTDAVTLRITGSSMTHGGQVVYQITTNNWSTYNECTSTTCTKVVYSTGTTVKARACNPNDTSICSAVSTYNVVINMPSPAAPSISATDGIASGNTHYGPTTLEFDGCTGDVVCYYGTSTSNMTNTGSSVTVSGDTSASYYVKACYSYDTSNCSSNVSYNLVIRNKPTTPSISCSDGDNIPSGEWHSHQAYASSNVRLDFSSTNTGGAGITYYYGTSASNMTTPGSYYPMPGSVSGTTIYVKACNSSYTSVCSDYTSYTLRNDITPPGVSNVAYGGYQGALVMTVSELHSGLAAVCVTTSSSYSGCSWITGISTVCSGSTGSSITCNVSASAGLGKTYYVFAKDNVGLVSSAGSIWVPVA